jgi:aspartyl-tRNA(Asn)/glutamyl-tRNA(Gln) amidotransferase subunit C
MTVDRELVLHIARLAHIELTESEVDLFTVQLGSILQYVEKLNSVVENAEPFAMETFLESVVREDNVRSSLPVDDVFKNAPDRKNNLFRVPRIIP